MPLAESDDLRFTDSLAMRGSRRSGASTRQRRSVASLPTIRIPRFASKGLRALLGRLDPFEHAIAISAVMETGDRLLLNETIHARRRSVPTDLRPRVTDVA